MPFHLNERDLLAYYKYKDFYDSKKLLQQQRKKCCTKVGRLGFINEFTITKGRRGITPTRNCTHLLKNILNPFAIAGIKLNFFLTSFLSLSD